MHMGDMVVPIRAVRQGGYAAPTRCINTDLTYAVSGHCAVPTCPRYPTRDIAADGEEMHAVPSCDVAVKRIGDIIRRVLKQGGFRRIILADEGIEQQLHLQRKKIPPFLSTRQLAG